MKTGKLSPTRLRMALVGAIVLTYLIQAGVIILGQDMLKQSSSDVTAAVAKSDTSRHTLDNLTAAEQMLQKNKPSVEKSKQIIANSTGYRYQTQIIDDLSNYAQETGLKITSFTFSDPNAATPGAAKTSVTPPASTAVGAAKSIAGLTPVTVSIQLVTPIDYDSFLKFLRLTESNLTHMQIQGVQVSTAGVSSTQNTPDASASPRSVNISSINLEVYTKK